MMHLMRCESCSAQQIPRPLHWFPSEVSPICGQFRPDLLIQSGSRSQFDKPARFALAEVLQWTLGAPLTAIIVSSSLTGLTQRKGRRVELAAARLEFIVHSRLFALTAETLVIKILRLALIQIKILTPSRT